MEQSRACKNELGDHHGAIDDTTKAIELDPKNAITWHNRGGAKNELGDYHGAIDDFTKAIKLNPKDAATWNNRGGAKNALGNYHDAIDDCTKAIELDPKKADAWNNRGWAKSELGDYQGAIDDYNKAVEFAPKIATAWASRGVVKFRLGKYEDAIKDLDEALRLSPANIEAQQLRQGVEIAKLRAESGEDAQKNRKVSREQLKVELKNLRRYLACYQVIRIALFVFLFDLIIVYWSGRPIFFLNWLDLSNLTSTLNEIFRSEPTSFSDFLFIVSRVSILSIIIFPVVWGIRLLNLGIQRAETLKWDIFSRINTESSIEYYQRELGNKRNDFIISYMKDWMNNNPADRLVALQRKKSAANEKSENETLLQEIRNLLERLTESNTKED